MSKVGNPQIYEAHEQRPPKHTNKNLRKKHDQGEHHVYEDIESEDERGIGKKITALYSRTHEWTNPPHADPKVDPLGPATSHGNEPSKGAKVDAELKEEEEELLRRKGKV